MQNQTLKTTDNKETVQLEQVHKAIKTVTEVKFHGEVVGKLASSTYFAHKDARVEDIANELNKQNDIQALGVVDANCKVLGIIVRRELFDLLSKPYGRDIMKHKTISRIYRSTPSFDRSRNIFSLADDIGDGLSTTESIFYILTYDNDLFYGIFTNRDMMVYLSLITRKDIALARSIQSSIVAEEWFYQDARMSIIGASRMAKGVGGDYYNVRQMNDDNWQIAICDVSGKGVAASLITTSISGLYSYYDFSSGLAPFIHDLNEYIYTAFDSQKFVTGLFASFNAENGHIEIYDMGHSYVYIYRDNMLLKLKTADDNLPLGITPEISVTADRYILHPGDILLLITDGIAEQANADGEEYGDLRILDVLKRTRHMGLKTLKEEIYTGVYRFRGTQPQHDDMTAVIIDYNGTVNQ